MDIITHALCGTAAGTVAASFIKGRKSRFTIIALSTVGGMLPDIDAVSLWSKFDKTIGAFFGLAHSGKDIYSAKFWYSHHGFMHSVFAGVLTAAFTGLACFTVKNKYKNSASQTVKQNLKFFFLKNKLLFIGFLSGYFLHLLGDIPTPSSTWGGIRLFFPFKVYAGGAGKIWWWNNYDIFLAVCCVIFINILLLASDKHLKNKVKYLTLAVFASGFCFAAYQTLSRDFSFAYSGNTPKYTEYEQKSKEIQKKFLGDKIYKIMEKIDKKLPVYF